MTTIDVFDPFGQRIAAAIDEIAAPSRPAYLDEVLQQTARTRQRPRWSFPGRWLPAWLVVRPARSRRLGALQAHPALVLVVVLLLLLAAAAVLVMGSQRQVPPPFGPAGNGQLAYTLNGDLYVRDSLDAAGRVLIATPGSDVWPTYSPDGTRILLTIEEPDGKAWDYVANADGSGLRRILPDPIVGNGYWAWAPDSRTIAIVNEISGFPVLHLASVDDPTVRTVDLGDLAVREIAWRPGAPDTLLLHGTTPSGQTDLYTIRADGSGLRALDLPIKGSAFGPGYTNSGAAWAPDGRTIAYNSVEIHRETLATHFRLHLVDADGANRRPVPPPDDPRVQEAWPRYSPDGRWILVHRWTWKEDDGGEGWIAVLPADGSAPARDIGPRIPGGEDTGLAMAWSPDGTEVLMSSQNTRQVFSIDPATGAYEELPWTTALPDWQRTAP